MKQKTTRIVLVAVAVVAVGTVGLYFLLRPEYCDGLPRSYGACSADRPTFSGDTCDEVAVEWGWQLDQRVLQVVDGPPSQGGESRSSRLLNAEGLTTGLANKHLRDNRLTPTCQVDEFMAAGESQFSERLVKEVGSVMYEGSPVVDYSQWRERIVDRVSTILADPHAPYQGSEDG